MKSITFLLLFLVLLSALNAFSQDYGADEIAAISDEELVVSDEVAVVPENPFIGEMEGQEEIVLPEDESEWSLGEE